MATGTGAIFLLGADIFEEGAGEFKETAEEVCSRGVEDIPCVTAAWGVWGGGGAGIK